VRVASERNVGCATQSTAAPNTNPSGTRLRASTSSSRARPRACVVRSTMQPLPDQIDDVARWKIEQAPSLRVALPLVVALAAAEPRLPRIADIPRSVALRVRWPKNADEVPENAAADEFTPAAGLRPNGRYSSSDVHAA